MDNRDISGEDEFESRLRKTSTRLPGILATLTDELSADDGPDGRRGLDRSSRIGDKPNPHAGRVGKAAQRVVDAFLAVAPAATGPGHFQVASVRSVRGAAVLSVTIDPRAELPAELATNGILEALRARRAHLRGMLATEIDGKQMPELQFVLKLVMSDEELPDLDD
ncbi:MAG: hypothetical protein IPG61_08490 [bacterium]|nr:hypothetical protein [bacterium]